MEEIDVIGKKLIKVDQFSNSYGVWRDLEDNYYYIAPEAEKAPREEWICFELLNIIYVYIEDMRG